MVLARLTRAAPPALRKRVGEVVSAGRTLSLRQEIRHRLKRSPGGLRLPGPVLRVATAGTADIEWFLGSGRLGFETIREFLAEVGLDIAQLDAALDFGCGCGRVLRHWPSTGRPKLYGCDIDGRAVRWLGRHMPWVETARTVGAPPLPWPDETFDLVWAFSVFTHLPREHQGSWQSELRRVTRRDGMILLSVHGSAYREQLNDEERQRFDRGELVERRAATPGSNAYGVYHPVKAVEDVLAPGTDLQSIRPRGARGNPPQDLVVLRRPF